ncbi:MAG: heme exporter protein CcmD [Sinobacteraceae bacterium]|nr:heme exporter protein CcmD [Nevskiaceae bacterium]
MDSGFWQMGGFAFYVWSAYGAAVLIFAWNLLVPRLRRRALLRELVEYEDADDAESRAGRSVPASGKVSRP